MCRIATHIPITMKCPACNNNIGDNDIFVHCSKCGTPIVLSVLKSVGYCPKDNTSLLAILTNSKNDSNQAVTHGYELCIFGIDGSEILVYPFELHSNSIYIGRDPGGKNDIALETLWYKQYDSPDERIHIKHISKQHGQVYSENNEVYYIHTGKTSSAILRGNNCIICQKEIKTLLQHNDLIALGTQEYSIRIGFYDKSSEKITKSVQAHCRFCNSDITNLVDITTLL